MKKPVVLIIMDGFGLGEETEGNAICKANTPNIDRYMKEYPFGTLEASGLAVGLPEGQMGNSEVGHLNLGAGRIVYQSLTRLNMACEDGSMHNNPAINEVIDKALKNGKKLHFMGLVSDGGVHSHIKHFKTLLDLAKEKGIKTYIHAFTDGRDTAPDSGIGFLEDLDNYTKEIDFGSIATVSGRYYAMDRDKNWNRTQKAYDSLVFGKGEKKGLKTGFIESYENGVTDEFIVPFITDEKGMISEGDSVIFVNFRPDRAIQLSTALTNIEETDIEYEQMNLNYVCMMHYSDKVKGEVAFGLQELNNTYGEVIANSGLKQLRIAETEKYAHVTFFFDGGEDKELPGATRSLIPSPKVATYDMKPEMSAYLVTEKLLKELDNNYDTVILNYANCDMVGHTGDIDATIKACEVVDECVGRIVEKILSIGGVALITADHGNADKLLDEDGHKFTAHTLNPVPFIVTDKSIELRTGNLGDIAPTMLDMLGIEKPDDMTGNSLIK